MLISSLFLYIFFNHCVVTHQRSYRDFGQFSEATAAFVLNTRLMQSNLHGVKRD